MGITTLSIVAPYSNRIGSPKDWSNSKENTEESVLPVYKLELKTA